MTCVSTTSYPLIRLVVNAKTTDNGQFVLHRLPPTVRTTHAMRVFLVQPRWQSEVFPPVTPERSWGPAGRILHGSSCKYCRVVTAVHLFGADGIRTGAASITPLDFLTPFWCSYVSCALLDATLIDCSVGVHRRHNIKIGFSIEVG